MFYINCTLQFFYNLVLLILISLFSCLIYLKKYCLSDEPCTSGSTPIISHCPTIIGESSQSGVAVMHRLQKSASEDSSISEEHVGDKTKNSCHA